MKIINFKKAFSVFLSLALVLTALLQIPTEASAATVLELQMYNSNRNDVSNTITPEFKLTNTGTNDIDLTAVKIRYYYTKDQSASQNFVCDNATIGAGSVTGTFHDIPVTTNADTYVEVGFTAGSLAAGGSVEIHSRIYNSNWSNYTQTNDYSFDASNTSYTVNDKATAYIDDTLYCGNQPDTTPTEEGKEKFLIIVANPIYNMISSQLQTYVSDVNEDGYDSTVIRVNNVQDGSTQFVCSTPQQLKDVIRTYYNMGYAGFVFVGSYPSIQAAYWRPVTTSNGVCKITDYYFADMGGTIDADLDGNADDNVTDWVDADNDNIFEVSAILDGKKIPQITEPEMFYGRIDAGGMTSTTTGQAIRIKCYLAKLHKFRLNRANIQSQNKKALGFVDDDWRSDRNLVASSEHTNFKDVFPHMKVIEEKMATNTDTLQRELSEKYYFEHIVTHGGDDLLQTKSWQDGVEYTSNFGRVQLNAMAPALPAAYYIHSYGCSTSRYLNPNYGSGTPVNLPNMGETYLFANNTTVNVTGVCDSIYSPLDQTYFDELCTMSIGKAYKNWVTRWYGKDSSPVAPSACPSWECVPSYVLLGDPTLKHPLTIQSNQSPALISNIGNLRALVGQQFVLPLTISDPENDTVTAAMSVAPDGASFDSSTNTITWTPTESQADGAGQRFVIDLTDTAGNTYSEEFNVYVCTTNNMDFELVRFDGQPYAWETKSWTNGAQFSSDSTVYHTGSFSAQVTVPWNANRSRFSQTLPVTPYTSYRLSGYIKTEDVVNAENGGSIGANLTVECGSSMLCSQTSLKGNNDWTYVSVDFDSGSNQFAEIECALGYNGNTCTGTAWFDDLTLEPIQ